MSEPRPSSTFRALALAVFVALATAACGGDDGGSLDLDSTERDTDRTDVAEKDEPDAALPSLEVGTCYDRADDDDRDVVDDVEVSCDAPHDAELIAVLEPPTETIPDESDDINADLYPPCVETAEATLGFPLAGARVGLAFTADGAPGGPYESQVNCFVTSPVTGGLVAPLDAGPIEAVTGDYIVFSELTEGDCFLLSEEDTAAGFSADCDEPDVLGFLGSFEAPDGPFPGNDELQALRDAECPGILEDSGLPADPETLSGTPPSQIGWDFFGLRTITCDVTPA